MFCPVFPFDFNEDGIDEIWYVGNPDHGTFLLRIAGKTPGPDGRFRQGLEEFVYDLGTGEKIKAGFKVYRTLPVVLCRQPTAQRI